MRTFYGWAEDGTVDIASLELPRKVRFKPRRKRRGAGEGRAGRTSRTYEDLLALPDEDRERAAQGDPAMGLASNAQRIPGIRFPRIIFQLYVLLADGGPNKVVAALDAIEARIGSREAFGTVMGVVLVDRGAESDGFEGMERSALEPGGRRCRVHCCDPMSPGQKASCERLCIKAHKSATAPSSGGSCRRGEATSAGWARRASRSRAPTSTRTRGARLAAPAPWRQRG